MEATMFCNQCQEAACNIGCTKIGVCGKKPDTSALQDVLLYVSKGLARIAVSLRAEGAHVGKEVNEQIVHNLFMTITNANFDNNAIVKELIHTCTLKKSYLQKLSSHDNAIDAAVWHGTTLAQFLEKANDAKVERSEHADINSLLSLIMFGLKGMAAYMQHASALGYHDDTIEVFLQEALAKTLDDEASVEDLLALVMKTGEFGVISMALLDQANTESFGNPEITEVELGVRKRPGILISGHDLKDLKELLEQSEGMGVDIYTHCEMLPAHYYPVFKKYAHFAGNYGNAWWKQQEEFEAFHGPILFTTNCLVPPKDSYKARVFTSNAVGFTGCKHIQADIDGKKDYSEIIALAKTCEAPKELETGKIVGGFAHNQVHELKEQVIDAVKSGAIRKFVVMAGCDGRMKNRSYYTDFAQALPKDSVILTAGCAKYRYNKLALGDIQGIPRVLDAGQCNDSYSLVKIALELKEAFALDDINELPIVYNIAWYEQKAVIVLLALLYLGVKNIHLGPTLPAFLSPNVVQVLVDKFKIAGITNVEDDMNLFFK